MFKYAYFVISNALYRVAAAQVRNDEWEEKLQQEIPRLQHQLAIISRERNALLHENK